MSIRRAVASDAAVIQELVRSAYEPYLRVMPVVPAPMLADYDEIVSTSVAWVAERAGEILGVLVLRLFDDHALVENRATVPAAQGLGIRTMLLEFGEDTAAVSIVLDAAQFDAVNGTPVVDIKPYLAEFAPRGDVHQPLWASELMGGYWASSNGGET